MNAVIYMENVCRPLAESARSTSGDKTRHGLEEATERVINCVFFFFYQFRKKKRFAFGTEYKKKG